MSRNAPRDRIAVVAGEALVDLVAPDAGAPEEAERVGGDVHTFPGGGPFNTARTLGRLGQAVAFLGRLSTDGFGRRLERILAADGVALPTVARTDEPTTLALAELDADRVASYRFYTEGTAAPGLTPDAALAALPEDVDMLHVGTLGLALEPIATAIEAVVDRIAGVAMVMVDPNVRPWAIAHPHAYRRRLDRLLPRAHVLKVSEADMRWIEPNREPLPALRALLKRGPLLGLLTRGSAGSVVVTRTSDTGVPAVPVKVVDTIGAGDAFGGGFLAWWREHALGLAHLERLDLVIEATAFASRVAALTCSRRGAEPPFRSELGFVGERDSNG
jgi:fructokinase